MRETINPNRRSSIKHTTPEVFWQRMKKPVDCWLYDGARDVNGYGYLKNPLGDSPKFTTAHRLAWILTNGPIPEGMQIRHKCDIRNCCNPAHLELGTHADNMTDKMQRRRCSSKLNEAQVREIRELVKTKGNKEVAELYGVTPCTIWCIKARRKWKHVQ